MSLRDRLKEPAIVLALGAHDPFTARIAEAKGLEAIYHGGYAVAAHQHGLPDIGFLGMTDMLDSLRRITAITDIPVIVDADTGYGVEPSMKRSMVAFEDAGAAAIQYEDQVFPKRCGHMDGKEVIPRDDMLRKLEAALSARSNSETLVIARTDALAVNGFDDAIERIRAYADIGADVVFVDAPRTRADLAEIAAATPAVLKMTNMTESGKTELLPAGKLRPSDSTW